MTKRNKEGSSSKSWTTRNWVFSILPTGRIFSMILTVVSVLLFQAASFLHMITLPGSRDGRKTCLFAQSPQSILYMYTRYFRVSKISRI